MVRSAWNFGSIIFEVQTATGRWVWSPIMCRIHVLTSSNWTDQKIQNFGNHTIETKLIYIYTKSNYINDFTSYYGFQKFELLEEFNLNWSVLASYALSATKLNVRSRFQPQILYCQSFMHFWPLEVQKFRAH